MRRLAFAILLAIVILSIFPLFTPSKGWTPHDYYIATDGVDTGSVCLIAAPCKTPAYVAPLLTPGDDAVMRAGSYIAHGIELGANAGECPTCVDGTDMIEHGGAITWKAYVSGGVIEAVAVGQIEASRNYYNFLGISCDGSNLNDGCLLYQTGHVYIAGYDNAHRIDVMNAAADGCSTSPFGSGDDADHLQYAHVHDNGNRPSNTFPPHHGCYWESSNGILEDVEFDHNQTYGFQFYNGNNTNHPSGNIVRRLSIHDNGGGMFVGSGASNNLIYNNLVYRNTVNCIDLDSGSNNQFYQNTVTACGFGGFNITGAAVNAILKNNIAYGNGGASITDNGSGTIRTNNFTSNPLFTDPNATPIDLTLSSSSMAINTGVNLSSILTSDYNGDTRPSSGPWEPGAYTSAVSPISSITPPQGIQGAASLSIALVGVGTAFDSTSRGTFSGTGITQTGNPSVGDIHHLSIVANINAGATLGFRDVSITTTGSPTVTKFNGFEVKSATAPQIISITPAAAPQCQQNQALAIVGSATNFVAGTTTVTFSNPSGITQFGVTVTDATHLTIGINIDCATAAGVRNIGFATNSEVFTANNIFTVTAISPCSGSGTSGVVTGQCTHQENPYTDTSILTPTLPTNVSSMANHYAVLTSIVGGKDDSGTATTNRPVSSVTSARGLNYSQCASSATNLPAQMDVRIAPITNSGPENTLTSYGGATIWYGTAFLQEFYGLATSSPCDVSGTSTGTSATPSVSTTGATTVAGDLIIACIISSSAIVNQAAPYTLLESIPNNACEYKIAGSTGTETATFSTSNAFYVATILALKPNTATPASVSVVSPTTAAQVSSNVILTLTGLNTHWGASTVFSLSDMGGIGLLQTTINSPTSATVRFNVSGGATLNTRDVIMTTGSEVARANASFSITYTRQTRFLPFLWRR